MPANPQHSRRPSLSPRPQVSFPRPPPPRVAGHRLHAARPRGTACPSAWPSGWDAPLSPGPKPLLSPRARGFAGSSSALPGLEAVPPQRWPGRDVLTEGPALSRGTRQRPYNRGCNRASEDALALRQLPAVPARLRVSPTGTGTREGPAHGGTSGAGPRLPGVGLGRSSLWTSPPRNSPVLLEASGRRAVRVPSPRVSPTGRGVRAVSGRRARLPRATLTSSASTGSSQAALSAPAPTPVRTPPRALRGRLVHQPRGEGGPGVGRNQPTPRARPGPPPPGPMAVEPPPPAPRSPSAGTPVVSAAWDPAPRSGCPHRCPRERAFEEGTES